MNRAKFSGSFGKTIECFTIHLLPDMTPVMTFTFWANKHRAMFPTRKFHRRQKLEVTVFTMVHINNCISSPLHT
jgi:hypothetical protein